MSLFWKRCLEALSGIGLLLLLGGMLFISRYSDVTEIPLSAILVKKAMPVDFRYIPSSANGLIEAESPEAYRGFFWGLDAAQDSGDVLPINFRTSNDAFRREAPDDAAFPAHFEPSREGLADLRASGSAEFSANGLEAVQRELRKYTDGPIIIVDLRQETHGFLNGDAVSWCGLRNWGNLGKSDAEAAEDEQQRLQGAMGKDVNLVVLGDGKWIQDVDYMLLGRNGKMRTTRNVHVTDTRTEEELVRAEGMQYVRFPATDIVWPRPEVVDAFVAFVQTLPEDVWLHFHCRVGSGRTTSFLTMYDMMRNPDVPCDDILVRQYRLGGLLFGAAKETHGGQDWQSYYGNERSFMVRKFYAYVQENRAQKYAVPWSTWLTEDPEDGAYQ